MQQYRSLSDEELIDLLKEDDIVVFEEIYNRYWSLLYSAAYRRCRSTDVAEEQVQDVFISLWTHRQTLHIHTSLQAYLLNAIRYRVLNHLQKEWTRRKFMDSIQAELPTMANSTEETVLYDDLSQYIEQELAQLPPKCRQVFELSRKEFKTNKEIARELAISEKTVENQITKALRILRTGLKDAAISLLISGIFFLR